MKQEEKSATRSLARQVKKEFMILQAERIIYAILLASLGVLFIMNPEFLSEVVCLVIAVFLLLSGVVSIIMYFAQHATYGNISMILGFVLLALGSLCYFRADVVQDILTLLIGLIIIADGAGTFVNSVECAKVKVKSWGWIMLLAVVTMGVGTIVLLSDFDMIMTFAGCALIIDSVCKILLSILFAGNLRSAHERMMGLQRKYYAEDIEDVEEVD